MYRFVILLYLFYYLTFHSFKGFMALLQYLSY